MRDNLGFPFFISVLLKIRKVFLSEINDLLFSFIQSSTDSSGTEKSGTNNTGTNNTGTQNSGAKSGFTEKSTTYKRLPQDRCSLITCLRLGLARGLWFHCLEETSDNRCRRGLWFLRLGEIDNRIRRYRR